jgi:tripartite-type tricarboxylate transporter receptor subunit TctC
LRLAAGAAALPAVPHYARAQNYPTRPVRIIVGFAAGGGNDILACLMGQWLSERLGQAFVIENRRGAPSNIGTEVVVRAPGWLHASLAQSSTLADRPGFSSR